MKNRCRNWRPRRLKGRHILRDRTKLANDPHFEHTSRPPGEDVCDQRWRWFRCPHRLSVQWRNIRLRTKEKRCADLYRRSSQCECSGNSPGIANASGCFTTRPILSDHRSIIHWSRQVLNIHVCLLQPLYVDGRTSLWVGEVRKSLHQNCCTDHARATCPKCYGLL